MKREKEEGKKTNKSKSVLNKKQLEFPCSTVYVQYMKFMSLYFPCLFLTFYILVSFFFFLVLASCSCVPAASFGPVLLVFRHRWAVSPLQLCRKRAEFHWTVYWPLVYTSHSLQINIRGMEMEAEGERAELQWRKTLSYFLLVIIKSQKNSPPPQVSNHLITQR